MGSISKCQKLSEELNFKQCEDRISNLPSSLITHILSFLPTKYAVATSVLSTRWKQSWVSITSLDFDDKLLISPQNSNSKPSLQTSFATFVYRVLLLHKKSCLQTFRLKCSQSYDVSHVNAWVAAVLLCPVQQLDLSIPAEHSTVLPRDLFFCRTLVVLKLGRKFVANVPSSVSVPSLKVLHLDQVKFLDDDSINRLLLGCPVLEELSMCECVGKDVHVINIYAPMLTSLIMKCLPYDEDVFQYKIVINAPALVYLEISDSVAEGYLLMNLFLLITAHIDIGRLASRIDDCIDAQFDDIHSEAITDLLRGISSVRFLHLYGDSMEAIYLCNSKLPTFHNMTSLDLGADKQARWELLPQLLENSPRLATLIFKEGLQYEDYQQDEPLYWYGTQSQKVPYCLLFHLKLIEICNFEGQKEEMKIVKYFLKNAKVLEKLTIHDSSPRSGGTIPGIKLSKKLLMLPRGSSTCRVELL